MVWHPGLLVQARQSCWWEMATCIWGSGPALSKNPNLSQIKSSSCPYGKQGCSCCSVCRCLELWACNQCAGGYVWSRLIRGKMGLQTAGVNQQLFPHCLFLLSFSASRRVSLCMNELAIKQNNVNGPAPSDHAALSELRLYPALHSAFCVLPPSPLLFHFLSSLPFFSLSDLMKKVGLIDVVGPFSLGWRFKRHCSPAVYFWVLVVQTVFLHSGLPSTVKCFRL